MFANLRRGEQSKYPAHTWHNIWDILYKHLNGWRCEESACASLRNMCARKEFQDISLKFAQKTTRKWTSRKKPLRHARRMHKNPRGTYDIAQLCCCCRCCYCICSPSHYSQTLMVSIHSGKQSIKLLHALDLYLFTFYFALFSLLALLSPLMLTRPIVAFLSIISPVR